MRERRRTPIFKRLETDAEFRLRLIMRGAPYHIAHDRYGTGLDEYAWTAFRCQRRIVEVRGK